MTNHNLISTNLAILKKAPLKYFRPKSVKTKNLGWIQPDGKIRFQSEKVAYEYAKYRVLQSLNAKNPFERAVIRDKNLILEEINGMQDYIDIRNSDLFKTRNCELTEEIKPDETIELIHGHPDIWGKGQTTLISCGEAFLTSDYAIMIFNNLKKITALNSIGEFNSITWLGNKTKMQAYKKHVCDFWCFSAKLLNKEDYNYYLDFQKRLTKHFEQNNKELSPELMNENVVLSQKVLEKVIEFFKSAKNVKTYHKFWLKKAVDYGVKYETNFSHI